MIADINKPFEIFEDEPWAWIIDALNKPELDEYSELDSIFRYFEGSITKEELSETLQSKTDDELKSEYNRRFTKLFANALINIGNNLLVDEPIEYDFSALNQKSKTTG